MNFLIITTNDLPEAYFLADFLLKKAQKVAIVSIRGRTTAQNLRIVGRLLRRRGWYYIANFFLLRLLRPLYQPAKIVPFPEIDAAAIGRIRRVVEHFESNEPHDVETINYVKEFSPDYILIAGAPVLRETLYGIAKQGALNRHLGLSPEYRGSDNPIWVLSQGKFDKIGYTIHFLSQRIDGGGIVLQRKIDLDPSKGFAETLAHISRVGSEGYVEVLDTLLREAMPDPLVQVKGGVHYPPAGLSTMHKAYMNYATFCESKG